MPTVPYKAHPTVEPADKPPEDYFHLQANPERFAAAAKGLEQFGGEVSKAADMWGQLQVDAQANAALKSGDELLNQLRNLHGQEQIDFANGLPQKIESIVAQGGQGLSPVQQNRYRNIMAPYQFRLWNGEMATSQAKAANEVAHQTYENTVTEAGDRVARFSTNPDSDDFKHGVADVIYGYKQLEVFKGNANLPGTMEYAERQGTSYAYTRAIEAIGVRDPVAALKLADDNKDKLGAEVYNKVEKEFHAKAEEMQAQQRGDLAAKASNLFRQDATLGWGFVQANRQGLGESQYATFARLMGHPEAVPGGAPAAGTQPAAAGAAVPSKQTPSDFVKQQIEQETKPPGQPTQLPGQAAPPKPGAQIDVPLDGHIAMLSLTRTGRAQLIEEAIKQYPPNSTIVVSGRKFPIPAAGTTFEIEGIKHTVPTPKAAAPTAQPAAPATAVQPTAPQQNAAPGKSSQNFSPIQNYSATGQNPAAQSSAIQTVNAAADPHQGAYTYFTQTGWTPAQSAGMVGALRGETENLNATESHDGGIGIGIAGWNGDRRAELQRFATANGLTANSRATQLQFVNHELNTTEKAAGDELRAATTPEQATTAMLHYLRPAATTAHADKRASYARDFYNRYAGDKSAALQFNGEAHEPHDHDIAAYRRELTNPARTAEQEQSEQQRAISSKNNVIEMQAQGGHIRDLPIKETLRSQLEQTAQATQTKVFVVSGGQPASGRNRTGSHRHDNGGAADIELRDAATGRLLDMNNPQDAQRMAQFVTLAVRNGATGVGAGQGYMGPHMMHIGGGTSASWGDAPWIRRAWLAGQGQVQQAAQ